MKGGPKSFQAWGVEIDDYDRRFLVGIGFSPTLTGNTADWSQPITTLMFKTREKARAAVARFRKESAWCFTGKPCREGGNRIYRSIRVVRLAVSIKVAA